MHPIIQRPAAQPACADRLAPQQLGALIAGAGAGGSGHKAGIHAKFTYRKTACRRSTDGDSGQGFTRCGVEGKAYGAINFRVGQHRHRAGAGPRIGGRGKGVGAVVVSLRIEIERMGIGGQG